MRVQSIPGIHPRLVEQLHALGYDELWPSQQEAAKHAVAGENLVLAVPTASGKSLVAYLALVNAALKGGKGLYIVPLRALASEKFEDLREIARPLGLRVAISIGDLDSADPGLGEFDIVVATSEKADALMRHRASWLNRIGCIVADEVHLLDDPGRGPTLEVLLARFRQLNPEAQIVALSATILNSREIADWLDAAHVKNDWRPVQLREGIYYGRAVQFVDNQSHEVQSDEDDPTLALAEDSVRADGQILVFVNTRRSTEAAAEKLARVVKRHLPKDQLAELKEAVASLKDGDETTSVEARLAKAVAGGAGFHHAGLTNKSRALVESLFKKGLIRALAATPTLAAGINLPARRVVIRDLWRFDVNDGNQPLPVLEYKQMAGRAGRPKYDKVGEAITLAKTYEQKSEILLNFILADPERVTSKLGTETALRSHVLASIATGYVRDERELKQFMEHTFFAHQSDLWTIEREVTNVIDFLLENELITQTGDRFKPTKFGERVSQLYIDPLSAVKLRLALTRFNDTHVTPLSFLHAVSSTPDMRTLYLRRGDAWIEGEVVAREEEFLLPPPRGGDYDFFLQELKTAFLLHDWVEEMTEDEISTKYGAYPGDVHNKVESAEWLLYAMDQIARLYCKPATKPLATLQSRVKHGAKEELLPLLNFRGVGRYRARQLWRAGLRSESALAKASLQELARVRGIGPALAASIKRELGQEETGSAAEAASVQESAAPEPEPTTGPSQRNLFEFGERRP